MNKIFQWIIVITTLIFKANATHLEIVNGNEVTPHSKPYQVFLVAVYVKNDQFCSGVLVSNRDIITTGRCIAGSNYVIVHAGAHNVLDQENSQVIVRATDFRICEDYDWDYGHNVAILKLSTPLTFNQFISAIPLNVNPGRLLGKTAQVSGWGGVNIHENISPVLRAANAVFVNASVCFAHDFDMTDVDVCMSGVNGATTCYADAGGPVVIEGQLVAILSPKEVNCGQWRSFAAVDLSKFTTWMRQNLEPTVNILGQ